MFIRSITAMAVGLGCVLSLLGGSATASTPSELKEAATKCARNRNYDCAEKNWQQYIALRPTDSQAMAILAIVYNWDDKPEACIVQAEKAIDMGEGTYDLFAAYARSLGKVGRVDDAIDWSYKTLAVVPNLVDVRGDLAKLLVMKKREFEALVLLASFDSSLEERGQGHYFDGQRIAIESSLERRGVDATTSVKSLRLPKMGDHFYAPVKLGDARMEAFMIDTGASKTTLNEEMLAKSKVDYKVAQSSVDLKLANGQHIKGRMVVLDTLKVGPYELHHVSTIVCQNCLPLLGQGSLAQFNMTSSKTQGVEFMTLEPRAHR